MKKLTKSRSGFSYIIKTLLVVSGILGIALYISQKSVESVRATTLTTVSTYTVLEDTYVSQKTPTTNFNSSNVLRIQNKSLDKSYGLVRFSVSGIPAGAVVNSASVNLYVSNGNKVGGSKDTSGYIAKVGGAWSSSNVTWKTAPTVGTKVKNFLPKASAIPGQWRTADVSNIVTANGSYDFYVISDSATKDDILYASLESTQRSAGSSTAKPYLSVNWSPANTSNITHGPVVGGVNDTSAKVFVRVGTTDQVRIEYSTNPVYDSLTASKSAWILPQSDQDFTAIIPISNLTSNTKYYYWITIGYPPANTLNRYEFTTFPSVDSMQGFKFSIFSDASSGNAYAPGYAVAASLNPVFVGQIGDFLHEDPGARPTPIVIGNWWTQDKQSIGEGYAGTDFANNIGNKFPFFHMWDDHDYCINNADKTCPYRDSFAKPSFLSYFPTYSLNVGDGGMGQTFRYGKEAQVFVPDLRYQRSVDTDPDGPTKSMLGDTQKAWLKTQLKAAQDGGVIWKILISTSIWNDHSKPEDSWYQYQTEQNELINFIKDNNVTNVIVISGDLHSGGAIDDGTGTISCSIGWCIPEISVPHTNIYNQNYCTGVESGGTKDCGTWAIGFLNAKDMTTRVSNAGFAHFTVTGSSLLMQVIREDGKVNLSYTVPVK